MKDKGRYIVEFNDFVQQTDDIVIGIVCNYYVI